MLNYQVIRVLQDGTTRLAAPRHHLRRWRPEGFHASPLREERRPDAAIASESHARWTVSDTTHTGGFRVPDAMPQGDLGATRRERNPPVEAPTLN